MPILKLGHDTVTPYVSAYLGIYREISPGGVYQIPQNRFKFEIGSDATDIGDGALRYAFYQAPHLYEVSVPSVTQVTGENALYQAFYQCGDI